MRQIRQSTNKIMPWIMIIALLISQSYAYALVSCESNDLVNSQHNEHMVFDNSEPMQHNQLELDMFEHMHQNTQQDTQQQETSMQCCEQDCSCLTGTCASATLIHSSVVTASNTVSGPTVLYPFMLQDTFLPSFLKPPISS